MAVKYEEQVAAARKLVAEMERDEIERLYRAAWEVKEIGNRASTEAVQGVSGAELVMVSIDAVLDAMYDEVDERVNGPRS